MLSNQTDSREIIWHNGCPKVHFQYTDSSSEQIDDGQSLLLFDCSWMISLE